MPFDNSLTNMQTPGRLHALCKLLLLADYTPERLLELLQPESPEKEQAKAVFKLARNGELVQLGNHQKVHLLVPKEDVMDRRKFEEYIADLAFKNTKFIFGRFTAWVMATSEKVLTESKEELAQRFFNEVSRKTVANQEYNSTNITGWMAWANYFGLGHTMNGNFIANPAKRIQIALEHDRALPRGEFIPFKQFMKWLTEKCPELDGGKLNLEFNEQFKNQQLSFALSLALRTLHDLKMLQLKNTKDVEDIWYFFEVRTHEIPNQVTDIMVKG